MSLKSGKVLASFEKQVRATRLLTRLERSKLIINGDDSKKVGIRYWKDWKNLYWHNHTHSEVLKAICAIEKQYLFATAASDGRIKLWN